jgi:hypothetical protein
MESAGALLIRYAMSVLSITLRNLELAMRLQAAVPSLEMDAAYAHIEAAEAAATEQVSAELLLGIAFVESRFDPTATSRVEGGVRRLGRYPSTTPPRRLDPRRGLFCGPLQTIALSWARCLAMRDLKTAYAAGASEITTWLRDRRVRGDIPRALAGHGCGNHGVRTGACNRYQSRVLGMERRFRLGTEPRVAARRVVPSS